MNNLEKIIKKYGFESEDLVKYGDFFKLNIENYLSLEPNAKLILTTSINPTSSGEGKTTVSIGIADALNHINKKTILALREPSIGPVFGRKGTATGGGESIIIPEDEINLHFTGDMYAIEVANNLISSIIDNNIYWKSDLNIDPKKVVWKRTSNLNDRTLREVEIKINKSISRKEEFVITAACDVMTILSLSKNVKDFERRINKSIVAYTNDDEPITVKDLKITGSILAILKNAFKPNIAITKNGSPTFIHCGPFANIAVGTNSVISTSVAMTKSDYVVTEAGFGSELGFEKYLNIICENNKKQLPSCVVVVVSVRALELHNDFENNFKVLKKHIDNVKSSGLNYIIAINKFKGDSKINLNILENWLKENNNEYSFVTSFVDGPHGSIELANKIISISENKKLYKKIIKKEMSVTEKIFKICNHYYGIDKVNLSNSVIDKIKKIENDIVIGKYPLCMVKSPNSLSGSDSDEINVLDIRVNNGGEFILVYLNNVFTMPGLSKKTNAESIKYSKGIISNLE